MLFAEHALAKLLPRAEKFGDLILGDHKVLNEDVNQETITDTLSLFKILPLNGFHHIRAKQRLHRRRKSFRNFFEPSLMPKVIYTDNSLEFGKKANERSHALRKGGQSRKHKETKKKVHFASFHVHLSPQERGVGTQITKIQRQSRPP